MEPDRVSVLKSRDLLERVLDSREHPRLDAGRNILAGHLRGWGLEFGGLDEAIRADPIYQDARRFSIERNCMLPEHKLQNLFLLVAHFLDGSEGDIVEFGSYKGGSACFIGAVLRSLDRNARVLAFDSYSGMPETDRIRDLHQRGDFSDAVLEDLTGFLQANELSDHVIPVAGLFRDSFPKIKDSIENVALAHIDCDIFEAVSYSIRAVKPKMSKVGGYIVFDDALHGSCLGAMQAVEEEMYHKERLFAEQAYPHLVFRYPVLSG